MPTKPNKTNPAPQKNQKVKQTPNKAVELSATSNIRLSCKIKVAF